MGRAGRGSEDGEGEGPYRASALPRRRTETDRKTDRREKRWTIYPTS